MVSADIGVYGLLLKSLRFDVDEPTIRAIAPSCVVKTLSDVARAFGIEPTSIRSGWRQQGMPGDPGGFDLQDVLVWRHRHEAMQLRRRPGREPGTTLERRKLEVETRKVELQAERLEREEQMAVGRLVEKAEIVSGLRTGAAVLAERLMKLPSKWEPSYPAELAGDLVKTQERDIRRELVAFSESSGRDVLKQGAGVVDL